MQLNRFRCCLSAVLIACAILALLPAKSEAGANYMYNGSLTVGDGVFNRPNDNGQNAPVSFSIGSYIYDVQPFYLTMPDTVSFSIDLPTAFDSMMVLYQGSFDPGNPLINAIIVDDDDGPGQLSFFFALLQANVSYFLVTTGFAENTTGNYSVTINPDNPATIVVPTVVPEPSSMVLMSILGGLALLGISFRLRRRG